jgi:hypothetical protein
MTINCPLDFKPKLIDVSKTAILLGHIDSVKNPCNIYAESLLSDGWSIYVVGQQRGRCYWYQQVITIPAWAFAKGDGYINYYLSHELAHAKAGYKAGHGPLFMQAFRSLCDEENQHHEIGYMTKQAILAGVIPPDL